jgi:hypothetical protein
LLERKLQLSGIHAFRFLPKQALVQHIELMPQRRHFALGV